MSITSASSTDATIPTPRTVKDYDCPFLQAIPPEIRFSIYPLFLPSISHEIDLTQTLQRREPLIQTYMPLRLTCNTLKNEVAAWYNGIKAQYNFTETTQYGPINLEHTIFRIMTDQSWENCSFGHREYENQINICTIENCHKKMFQRLGLLNPPIAKPFWPIRRLQLSLTGEDCEPMGFMSPNDLAVFLVKKITHLKELDVFLLWGLEGRAFWAFWYLYCDPKKKRIRIPVNQVGSQLCLGWPVDQVERITVWHGPKKGSDVGGTGLESPMQKLRGWREGKPEIFEVRDLQTGNLMERVLDAHEV